MSSLAATQADGYYLPPEYFESGQYKKKSKNAFAASQAGVRLSNKNIVRFELPYRGFCLGPGCKDLHSIGRGTRFDAEKVSTGEKYFTTPIWEFQMKCRRCQHPWRIRTNPQARGFDYVEGVRRAAHQDDDDNDDDTSTIVSNPLLSTDETTSTSALSRLETASQGKRKALTERETLEQLQSLNAQTTLQDASLNQKIRASFRSDRKSKKRRLSSAQRLGWRAGMEHLETDALEDVCTSRSMVYGRPRQLEQQSFSQLRQSSILDKKYISRKGKRRSLRPEQPETVVSSMPPPPPPPPVHPPISSSSKPKRKVPLQVLADAGVKNVESTRATDNHTSPSQPVATFGLAGLLGDYGSSSDSDEP
eukprot:Nitzschia sp. Nitz4//scaffold334_size18717//16855//17943//NITZ4_008766-RA/size18717-processed-gene-0.18-mRNA-1//-1//CDS//3329548263//3712//frame0